MDYKKNDPPMFLDKLKEVIDEQERELERAVIDRGKYEFCAEYRHLVKEQSEWFLKMSASQKGGHLKKVANAKLRVKMSDLSQPSCSAILVHSMLIESSDVPHSDSNRVKESHGLIYDMLPSQDHQVPIDCEDDVPTSSQHHRISLSSAFQPETYVSSRPTCSRRLFESQYESAVEGELLTSAKTVPVSHVATAQCHSSVSSHQYSTVASTSQIRTVPSQSHATTSSPAISEDELLSVAVSDFSSSVITPVEVLKAIWRKAFELLNESKSVSHAPGQSESARMVKSYSGPRPHLVTRKKSGQYVCDNMCPNWRSLGICAHSVAAAEDNQELHVFVRWYSQKRKKFPALQNWLQLRCLQAEVVKDPKHHRRKNKRCSQIQEFLSLW